MIVVCGKAKYPGTNYLSGNDEVLSHQFQRHPSRDAGGNKQTTFSGM
jgi:hypothetical protein